MKFFNECIAFFRFFSRAHAPHRQLVFYAESAIYYQTFEPFIEALLEDPTITCSYITSDPNDPILRHHAERLYPFYFDLCLKAVLDRLDATCLVFTVPDLDNDAVHAFKKSTKPSEYIYLFHAFSSTHLQYCEKAFDAYDTVFCVGPHHIAEIQKREQLHHLTPKNLLPIGYPRIDHIAKRFQTYQKQHSQPTVLIAPTWGPTCLLENGIEPLMDALASSDYRVVIRPHPEFLKRRAQLAQALKARVSNLPNFVWEDHLIQEDTLYEADTLITDHSGIAFEYAFGTNRPVLFIETPLKKNNPHWEALGIEPIERQLRRQIGTVITLDVIDTIIPAIQALHDPAINWPKRLQALRQQHVFNNGCAAKAGADYLKSRLQA